ncbi:MAG: pantetheine-phosphate adenylyltransferase [Treponemataceae bacterium]
MSIAVFAGSFDPPTLGHLDIIRRAAKIFTELHVVIAINSQKQLLFTAEERQKMVEDNVGSFDNVKVVTWTSLIVSYARKVKADTLIRGVRNVADFSYEFDLAILNKSLDKDLETLFLVPDPKYFVLRSSAIKELARYNGDVSTMVPKNVALALREKFKDVHKKYSK